MEAIHALGRRPVRRLHGRPRSHYADRRRHLHAPGPGQFQRAGGGRHLLVPLRVRARQRPATHAEHPSQRHARRARPAPALFLHSAGSDEAGLRLLDQFFLPVEPHRAARHRGERARLQRLRRATVRRWQSGAQSPGRRLRVGRQRAERRRGRLPVRAARPRRRHTADAEQRHPRRPQPGVEFDGLSLQRLARRPHPSRWKDALRRAQRNLAAHRSPRRSALVFRVQQLLIEQSPKPRRHLHAPAGRLPPRFGERFALHHQHYLPEHTAARARWNAGHARPSLHERPCHKHDDELLPSPCGQSDGALHRRVESVVAVLFGDRDKRANRGRGERELRPIRFPSVGRPPRRRLRGAVLGLGSGDAGALPRCAHVPCSGRQHRHHQPARSRLVIRPVSRHPARRHDAFL